MLIDPIDAMILDALRRIGRPIKAVLLVAHVPIGIADRTAQVHLKRMEGRGLVHRPLGVRRGWALAA